jgi:hypothetical protein
LIAGIVVLLAGIGGGLAAFVMSGSAADAAVDSLARAPVGCTTRLDFDKPGTFTVYVETKGTVDISRGDCPANGEDYARESEDLPSVELVLTPEDSDNEIDFEDDDSKSYDAGGAAGQSISSFDIEEAGQYNLTVTSDDEQGDFAIAVGKNPEDAADTLKLISYIVIGAGVVLGALLIVLGLRRTPPPSSGVGAPITHYPEAQPPAAYAPTGAHTPPSPPPFGGFGPPSTAPPPADPYPPTQPMPAPRWPAPPTN